MSAWVTGMVIRRYPGIGGEFTLALILADIASEDGQHIFPAVDTMAANSRQNVRSVQRHLRRMLELGWLIHVRPAGGRGRPAEYRISPRWLTGQDLPLEKGDTVAPIGKGDTKTPIRRTGKGDTVAPNGRPKRVTATTPKGDNRDTAYKNHTNLNTPQPPKGGAAGFDQLAQAYPRHRINLRAAQRRFDEIAPDAALLAWMLHAVDVQSRSPAWLREEGRAVPNLSKWLINESWSQVDNPATRPQAPAQAIAPREELSTEQLAINKERAIAAASLARRLMGKRAIAA